MSKEEEHKHDWSSICATNDNRNQCSEKNCTIYPICKIKEGKSQTLEEVKEKIEKFWKDNISMYDNDLKELLSQLGLEETFKEHIKNCGCCDDIPKEKGLKRIDGDAQSIAEFGIGLILDNIDKKEKGCGKPINGDLENPDWFCGDFLEHNIDEEGRSLGRRYFCDECNKKEISSEEGK